MEAGVSVEWPDSSTQAGWDLLLGGHEANIKLVTDASTLTQHFAQYPEIPAIIPGDALNLPATAIHFDPIDGMNLDAAMTALESGESYTVLVNEALSKAEVLGDVADATDLALGSADIFSASIPLVTLAFSSVRELGLLPLL